jgi:hypothetical protein
LVRQLVPGSGEGQHTGTIRNVRHMNRSESKRPIKRAGSGHRAYVLRRVRRHKPSLMPEHGCRAQPIATQLGGRLACSPPLAPEKLLHIEGGCTLQHVIDGPGQLMRQDGQGLVLTVFVL